MANTLPNTNDPILSDFAGDPDYVELIEMFVSELPQRATAMDQAFENAELDTLGDLAHQLKGAAGGYGFPRITDAAMVLELATKGQADRDTLREHTGALTDLCRRACATSQTQR